MYGPFSRRLLLDHIALGWSHFSFNGTPQSSFPPWPFNSCWIIKLNIELWFDITTPGMPKVRPRVCHKSAFLGPVRFQDAIWKCFKCQKKCDTLSSVFISFSPVCLFPWHLYGLRVSSLRLSVQHTDLGKALLCTKQLCLLTIYFCFFFLDSLTFVSIMLLWPTPKLLNTFFLVWLWHWALSVLCASYTHGFTLSGQGQWPHGQSWALHVLGSPYHCVGPQLMKPRVFSKCVPVMAAGYPETLRCPGPECYQEIVRQ